MPSRWTLRFDLHPQFVAMHHVHAVICGLLDTDGTHRDPQKEFAVSPPELLGESHTGVEVRLLADDRELVDRFVRRVEQLGERGVRFGEHAASLVRSVSGGPLGLREAVGWAELAERAEPLGEHTVHVLSPAYSRNGNTPMPFPMPGSVLRSLSERWGWHAADLQPRLRFDDAGVAIAGFRGETVEVQLGPKRHVGFVGSVTYSVGNRSPDVRRAVHQLLLAAPFTGIGSSTTYGFGTVELE